MNKTTAIIIALIMIGVASTMAFEHNNNNAPLFSFLTPSTLQQNPYANGTLYASGGLDNASGETFGEYSFYMVGGETPYYYNNQPYIATGFTPDSTSTPFSQNINFSVTWNNNPFNYEDGFMSVDAIVVLTISGTSYSKTIGSWNLTTNIGYSSSDQTYLTMQNMFSEKTITGLYNAVATLTVYGNITANPPGGYGGYSSATFHIVHFQASRQLLILPSTASLSQPTPNPVEVGKKVDIQYSTGFSPVNSAGYGYQLLIIGSYAYNNGQIITTVNLKDNIQNGNYYYTIPLNAFFNTTLQNANQFEVKLLDLNFNLAHHEFFTIDNYSYEPPQPVVSIINAPSNGQYYSGQSVTVQVNYSINQVTKLNIAYVDIWVYSGQTLGTPSQYILDDKAITTVGTGNGSITFTFTVPDNTNNLYIQAQAVDSEGRASSMVTYTIASTNIHTNKNFTNTNVILEDIAFIVAGVAGIIAFLLVPIDVSSRVILITGWLVSLLIVYGSYVLGGI
jgi:hypothetical protein